MEEVKNDDWMMTGEAARRLRVATVTINRLVQAKKLPYRRNTYGWKMFRKVDIDAMALARQQTKVLRPIDRLSRKGG